MRPLPSPAFRPPFRPLRPFRLLRFLLISFVASLALLGAARHVIAQLTRTIPADSYRGSISHVGEAVVRVNGTNAMLAANARIMSRDNLTIVPGAIPPNSPARFQVDANGYISRVWLLNDDEVTKR